MLQEIHGISFHPFILEDERQFGTRIIVISSVRDSNQNLNENPPLITKVSEKQQQFGTSRDWINIIFPFDTNWTSMKIATCKRME